MRRLLTPFGMAALGCLVLAGWALWTAGILDGAIAREVRGSSVYAAPGVDLDTDAAERIIGNRRLVVVLLEPGADLRDACGDIDGATQGTVGLILSRDGDDYDTYGCAQLPDEFGKSFVAEMRISAGIDQFPDRPLEALKVAAVNYDRLVSAGIVPNGARTISPSLPRYLIAAAAVTAVLLGSATLYLLGRRSARATARRLESRAALTDDRTELSAATGALAHQIIALDTTHGRTDEFRHLAADYAHLLDTDTDLPTRLESLTHRANRLAASTHSSTPRRRPRETRKRNGPGS